MAQNISLWGANYQNCPAVDLPKQGGGTARFTDVSDTTAGAADVAAGKYFYDSLGVRTAGAKDYSWIGDNVTLLYDKFYSKSYTLAETGFNTWTPSTTASAIILSSTLSSNLFSADMANYEYIIEWLWDAEIEQTSGATLKATIDRQFGTIYQVIHRRPYGLSNFETLTASYNYCTTEYAASSFCVYWNANGTRAWTSGISYGFYAGATAAAISSTSSDTPNITPKTPVINARCNNAYMTTARAAQIDKNNSTVKIQGNIYRVDINTNDLKQFYMRALSMYSTPL